MAETTGYAFPADTVAAQYRSAYAQSHMERLRADWISANQELFARYSMDVAREKYLQDQIDAEREYLLKLDELVLAPPKTTRTSSGEGGGKSELLGEIEALKDLQIEKAKRASENQDRVAKLMEIQDLSWSAPTSSVVALSNLASSLSGQPGLYATPEALAGAIQSAIAEDRYSGAVAALSTEEQRRDAGIKLVGAVSARTGLPASQSRVAVAQALGLNPDDLDPVAFSVEKDAARDQALQKAYAATDYAGELEKILIADISQRTGGKVVALTPEQQAQKTTAEKYVESPEFGLVKKALADGSLDAREVVFDDAGDPNLVTPEMIARYEENRRAVQKYDVSLAESDAQYFDQLFLDRAKARAGAESRISAYEKEMATLRDPVTGQVRLPTVEDARNRTAALYEPHSGRTALPPVEPDRKSVV